MLYSNTPFQSHKMELKERATSIKQKGRMLYNNTPPKKLHKKRQIQSSRDALHKLQTWGKRAQGRWIECPHGAVRIEGYQRRPYGFVMKDGSSMPRCKRSECVEQMKAVELSKTYQDEVYMRTVNI